MIGIGELSRRTGCNIETIRFYEKDGLMPEPPRSAGGHRLYGASHLQRLAFIIQARSLGFNLAETANLLALSEDTRKSCGDVLDVVSEHLESVQSKITALQAIEKSLQNLEKDCFKCCPTSRAPDCTILECFAQRPASSESI